MHFPVKTDFRSAAVDSWSKNYFVCKKTQPHSWQEAHDRRTNPTSGCWRQALNHSSREFSYGYFVDHYHVNHGRSKHHKVPCILASPRGAAMVPFAFGPWHWHSQIQPTLFMYTSTLIHMAVGQQPAPLVSQKEVRCSYIHFWDYW